MWHIYLKWTELQGKLTRPLLGLLCLLSSCGTSSIPDKPSPPSQKQGKAADSTYGKMNQTVHRVPDHKNDSIRRSIASTSIKRSSRKTSGVGYTSNRPYERQVHLKSPESMYPLARSQHAVRNILPQAPREDKGARVGNATYLMQASERRTKVDKPITQKEVNDGIASLRHHTELGSSNAANVNDKGAIVIAGVTGSGKSTTVNHLVGCKMTTVLDKFGEKIIVVDPESNIREITSIGHERRSRTFMPQIIQDPNQATRVYVDCPGFSDNRGPEINIANAINIRKVLRQARGVKAIFLTGYNSLREDRGESFDNLGRTCMQMFGGVDNLRRHQNSVLLGINRAPAQITTQTVRAQIMRIGSDTAAILADRAFLYDPLERGGADFWSRERFLEEIEQMPSIPQQIATNLFQTALNNGDKALLQQIVEHQVDVISTALEQEDYPAADRCWNLLNQLRIIEHDRIEELIEGQVRLHMRTYAAARTAALSRHAATHQFEEAEQILTALQALNRHFPNEDLVDLEGLQETLQTARAQHTAQQEAEEARQRAEEETQREVEARQRAEEERERARREREAMEARVRKKEAELEEAKRRNRNRR